MWYAVSDEVTEEAVTPAEVSRQLRLNPDEDPADHDLQVSAARAHVEAYCNQSFAAHSMEWACDSFADFARLPAAPAASITAIAYVDGAGEAQSLGEEVFILRADGLEPRIDLRPGMAWPQIQQGSRISVTGSFGGRCPKDVSNAMLLLIGGWDDVRENAVQPIWTTVDSLLSNHRRGAW
ncbi:hypothetical protein [Paracoccus sp. (in: a-proteobacteria)]|uniref:head-tail connector protein n=1 Tax=Paracoccus sp. TaxID=267 RepID=UPI00289D149C|nr:hypothetical protein [Paracoccus sp. (in: a-proteobacteria)]